MMAAKIAPGMNRSFLAEQWTNLIPKKCWYEAVDEADALVDTEVKVDIQGYDIDGDIVRDWMVSMMEAGRAATTVNRRLSAVRALYRYALKREWVKADLPEAYGGPRKRNRCRPS